jgi:hypothetical protein
VEAPGLPIAAWAAALDIAVQRPHSVDKRLAGQVELAVWRSPPPGPGLVTELLMDRVRQELAGRAALREEGEGATYRL